MILLIGLPGSGKGTQGKMLADQHGLHLVSMGELVRLYMTGDQRQRMLAGELLDDQEVTDILDRVLKSLPDNEECVLDGFPRTIPQAEWLLEQVKNGRFKIRHIFHLDASGKTVAARLKARGRTDDRDEVIQERFHEYEELTHPLLDWFRKRGLEVTDVNAERTPAEVNDDLIKYLESD
ncbi:MAG TPA: nucleoside monophosphate kinase [Candidatus Saccharimonadales bacterium]|nr:nucleoside monophosphate kinase [Candidatus Saccharimonadales bacterium]